MKTLTTLILVCTTLMLLLTTASKATGNIGISEKGQIFGRIIDLATGNPLASVSVDLYTSAGLKIVVGTLTNNKGEFKLTMLEPGNYYLDISMTGYESFRIKNIVVKNDGGKIDAGEIQLSKVSKKAARLIAKMQLPAKELDIALNSR